MRLNHETKFINNDHLLFDSDWLSFKSSLFFWEVFVCDVEFLTPASINIRLMKTQVQRPDLMTMKINLARD